MRLVIKSKVKILRSQPLVRHLIIFLRAEVFGLSFKLQSPKQQLVRKTFLFYVDKRIANK